MASVLQHNRRVGLLGLVTLAMLFSVNRPAIAEHPECGSLRMGFGSYENMEYSELNKYEPKNVNEKCKLLHDKNCSGIPKICPPSVERNDLIGEWKYSTEGTMTVTKGLSEDEVVMELNWGERPGKSADYRVTATLSGNKLNGTWKFLVKESSWEPDQALLKCEKAYEEHSFFSSIEDGGKRIEVLKATEDPCGHSLAGLTIKKN